MTTNRAGILLVDDDAEIHRLAETTLAELAPLRIATSLAEAEAALDARPEVILLDLDLGGEQGDELLDSIVARSPLSTIFVLSASRDLDRAVDLLRRGAEDYLSKPIEPMQLRRRVERAVVRHRLATKVRSLEIRADGDNDALAMLELGASTPMLDLVDTIRRVASSEMTALIVGETGTGKELVARALHGASKRSEGPFVTVNCGALPRELMEAELFGHTAGAFTGASGKRKGLVAAAEGGTLFLDEVGELPLELQPKLLRFLQEGEIRAVGSDKTLPVDVRVVAATHQALEARVADGSFREDLFFRLQVLPISVPPLRDRQSDVPGLAEFFLREAAARAGRELKGFERAALRALMAQPWPGNVRELQNRVRRSVVYADGPLITIGDLDIGDEVPAGGMNWPGDLMDRPFNEARADVVAAFEHAYVSAALEEADGNVAEAARRAGLPRKSLWRIAQRVGLAADKAARKAGFMQSGDGEPEGDSAEDDVLAVMQAERAGYRDRTLKTLEEAEGLLDGSPGLEAWARLKQIAHRLRGSGASYGFAAVSEHAERWEAAAEGLDAPTSRVCVGLLRDSLGA